MVTNNYKRDASWYTNSEIPGLELSFTFMCACIFQIVGFLFSVVLINFWGSITLKLGFLGDTAVKNPPAMQETRVLSLGSEDPLVEEMATCSSIVVWEIPWTEGPGMLQFMELKRVGHDWATEHTNSHVAIYKLGHSF